MKYFLESLLLIQDLFLEFWKNESNIRYFFFRKNMLFQGENSNKNAKVCDIMVLEKLTAHILFVEGKF